MSNCATEVLKLVEKWRRLQ